MKAPARPLSGAILGIILGLAVAIILQQQGIWPLDKLTVFLLPGATGLLAVVLTTAGKAKAPGALTVALIITIPLAAFGATGLGMFNQFGQLNGGCQVIASSGIDNTTVTDSSRRDPFTIDPNGGLSWAATSPGPIKDHTWEIWVELGGAQVPVQRGGDPNEGESTGNRGDVGNVSAYAEDRGIPLDQLRGVFVVGGFINGTGGACDGFGFVKLLATPFETILSKIALAIAIIALIILLLMAKGGRKPPVEVPGAPDGGDGGAAGTKGDGGGGGQDEEDGTNIATEIAAAAMGTDFQREKAYRQGLDAEDADELDRALSDSDRSQEPPPLPGQETKPETVDGDGDADPGSPETESKDDDYLPGLDD